MTGTILIADDHPLFRQAVAMAARNAAPDAAIVEAGTLMQAADKAAALTDLALILLDLKMPGAQGYSGIALLHASNPAVPILVISSAEAREAGQEAIAFGAVGFIGKSEDLAAIERAIGRALAGERVEADIDAQTAASAARVSSLTPAELRVLLGMLSGRLNKQIAYDLAISESTVKSHSSVIFRKLGVRNRTQAALAARALGLNLDH